MDSFIINHIQYGCFKDGVAKLIISIIFWVGQNIRFMPDGEMLRQ